MKHTKSKTQNRKFNTYYAYAAYTQCTGYDKIKTKKKKNIAQNEKCDSVMGLWLRALLCVQCVNAYAYKLNEK